MKLLCLSTRRAKPSFRFRVEAMLPYLAAAGHECETAMLPAGTWQRARLFRRARNYDAVLVQKRLLSRTELFLLRSHARRLFYDVDDAVMYRGSGEGDRRRAGRFAAMVRAADLTICGNTYLLEHALDAGAGTAVLIPTAIDSEVFSPAPQHDSAEAVTIGWTGSRSTNAYLGSLFPVLRELRGNVRLKFLSDSCDDLPLEELSGLPWEYVPWSKEVEVREAASFDIGLMPLPDDPWTRGKCGFKALQYMALGRTAVVSPVGVNAEIVTHGETGFHCRTPDEWKTVLQTLIDDASLRKQQGAAGRHRIEADYALNVVGPRLVRALEWAIQPRQRTA